MNLQEFCDGIGLDPGAKDILYSIAMDEKTYESYKKDFYCSYESFIGKVKEEAGYRRLILYLYSRFAADAYEQYQIRGINDGIYFDTFSDISIWCRNCLRDYGEYGMEQYHWLREHIQLKVFRLGRLQFQPYVFDGDCKEIKKNEIVLCVHIPQGGPLNHIEESFDQAKRFFRGIQPFFVCHSWLLFPELNKILEPDSNILSFQKYFTIYKKDETARQAEERIFNKISDDFYTYEEKTSLQRNAKAYLIAGNRLGMGYGFRKCF